MPLINRPLLHRDLSALSRSLGVSLNARLTPQLRAGLAILRVDLTRELSRACSQLEESSDAELAAVIDALGRELGALRGAREPLDAAYLEAHPEIAGALAAILGRLL